MWPIIEDIERFNLFSDCCKDLKLEGTKSNNTQKDALGWYGQINSTFDHPVYKINDTGKSWVIMYGTKEGWEVII